MGRQAERADIHRLLDEGELDVGVGCFEPGAARYRGKYLFEQTLSCCFNPKLLDLSAPVDLEAYVSLGHALVTLRDDLRGCLAEALSRSNVELNVVVASSNFLAVLSIASQAPVLARWCGQLGRTASRARSGCVHKSSGFSAATRNLVTKF